MKKINSTTFWIFLSTFALTIIFLFAIIKIYELTINETKKNHQLQQMEMAKAATSGIHIYLELMLEDMLLITSFPDVSHRNENLIRKNIESIYNHYKKKIVRTIFLANMEMEIDYKEGNSLPLWLYPELKNQLQWTQNPDNWQKYWLSSIQPNFEDDSESGMSFMMLKPIIQEADTLNLLGKPIGVIGYLFNFEALIKEFIEHLKLSKNDFAWIIDGNGRLIYHPTHTDMLLRTTKETKSDCNDCHSSFKIQNRMLVEPASVGEYIIGDEPAKIMAYVPMQLANEKWILVISTFLPEVTENIRDKFKLFFLLGVIILAAIVSFGLSLYYVNTRRIRAEEAKRQSEQMQQLQDQLNQASKLASIGELVDTMAHEINTPAGIISAHADAVLLQMGDSTNKYAEEIRVIKDQTRRISTYTKSLLGYSKRVPFQPAPTQVNKLMDESLYLLGHRFRSKNIEIKKKYSPKLKTLLIDNSQTAQVFINILNNAVDAFEDNRSGLIKINLHNIFKSDDMKEVKGVEIEIEDNGSGIEEKNLQQIFEPFFTTKLILRGTGLGLYISKVIIQRHNGKIEVHSEIGQGTTFKIYLPAILKKDE